jgi:RNA polymerase sigma-70 factor (sigma-E family)
VGSDRDDELERFVQARAGALLRYGYVLSGNPHDAADLAQEALARLGMAWPRVRHRGDPEAYVRTTMARLHISRWRRLRREVLVGEPPDRAQHDGGLVRADGDSGMWRALAALPTKQRAVLVLRYYEQLTDEEIATTLGISRVTVRTQAHRALAKLRSALAPAGSRHLIDPELDLAPGGAS